MCSLQGCNFPLRFGASVAQNRAMRWIPRQPATLAAISCWTLQFAASASGIPGLVTNWGDSGDGLTNFPGGILTNVVAVSCGLSNNLALKADGTMVAWGAGQTNTGFAPDYGQSIVPAGLSNVTAISAGEYHTLAISNGTVLAWGYNNDGQTTVPAGLNSVAAIAAGSEHSMALRSNGTVVAWGFNGFGETNVPTGLTNASAIAAGDIHSMALLSNGTVWAWGGNLYGQTNVPPGLTNASAIAAGMDHSLALLSNGTVWAWGYNGLGETNVPTNLNNVAAIAAGGHQSVAITSNGLITIWGSMTNLPAGLTNVGAAAASGTHGLLVTLNPVLIAPPPSEVFLLAGANTNLSLSAWSGTPLHYQWLQNGSPLAQATAATLAVTNFALSNAGVYTVTASNSFNYLTASAFLRPTNSPIIYVNGSETGGGTVSAISSAQITMTNTGAGSAIYYTLDGTVPSFTSFAYSGPFTLTNSAIITAIAYNASYTATFEAAPINMQVNALFPLSATTPGGGTIGISPSPYSGSNYLYNTAVTLTATPAPGWTFMNWSGDSTATTNVISFDMTAPHTVQAIFGLTPATNILGNGQLLFNPSNGPYAYGTIVQITAQPAAGSYFFGWANAASGFGNPLLFDVNTTNGLTALFGTLASNQVTLEVLPIGNGTITVNPSTNVYTNGETVTLTAVATSNSTFSAWGGDVTTSATNPLVTVLTSNEVITGTFTGGASSTNPPVIMLPPLSRTLPPGVTTTLSFQATGTGPFSYQWRFNSTNIPGATGPTLLLKNFSEAQAGVYAVSLTGAYGITTSPPASVALFNMELAPSDSPSQSLPLLILDCAPGASFQLEYTSDLTLSNWVPFDSVTLTGNEYYYVDEPTSNNALRFYRALPQ